MTWVFLAILVLANIAWYHLFKFMRREYFNKGKRAGLQEAVTNINRTIENEMERMRDNYVQLPNVPLQIWKCEDHYHVSMSFANVYCEHVIPNDWEKLEPHKRKDFFRYVRKELTDEILKVGNQPNERGNNAKIR